ncbi:hypothetical protein KUV51_18805 [Tateyamaria omphalii]|uniref:hypothetical protein n=1 Tax=Tateyamaria omphalii TaxID=299262 RepID=UPI001C99DE89|nr:hypothetical protein [Tateyamaria omphalii]MBY5935062.1 hypothetical protein [Tateyamaria omphalii]
MQLIIIGFGPVAGYKYSRCIQTALKDGSITSYKVVDLESQREAVLARLEGVPRPPDDMVFIPDEKLECGWPATKEWLKIHGGLFREGENAKYVITTEPRFHEDYINAGLDTGSDVLVAKPAVLPSDNGILDASIYRERMELIAHKAQACKANSGVICLGRHHEIYEDHFRKPLQAMVDRLRSPITSIHLKTASGVWNLPDEFYSREDHPYKYGYGMLLHGAYHYVDIFSQLLLMNRIVYPEENFQIKMKGFKAGPEDQNIRIPLSASRLVNGYNGSKDHLVAHEHYGETDIIVAYSLCLKSSGRVLTFGTVSLEQTTPGLRSWQEFPEVPYNINGRLHCTDIDARIGPFFGIAANVTKSPIGARIGENDLRGQNMGSVVTRSNARLTGTQGFFRSQNFERPYSNSYSYSAEAEIFKLWLQGANTGSDFNSHVPTCAILEALLKVARQPHETQVIDYDYALPSYLPNEELEDPWYSHMDDATSFSYKTG